MRGIQYLFLIAFSTLTAANPTANYAVTPNSIAEKINDKEIPKIARECLPFSIPADCEEVRLNGNTTSGVHTIWPRSRKTACKSIEVYCDMRDGGGWTHRPRSRKTAGKSIEVYCDMRVDGGGWTVLQRRGQYGNAQNYFHKAWESYKHGFGELEREFWLGNEIIYALTNQGSYSVRFDLRHVNGTTVYAVFDQFWIEDEERKYQLSIAGYSGNAGDSMSYHHSMKFSTFDSDNDDSKENCAAIRGGWWFFNCLEVNLNGLNKLGKYVSSQNTGIFWKLFTGHLNSLEFSEIKIRPSHFR